MGGVFAGAAGGIADICMDEQIPLPTPAACPQIQVATSGLLRLGLLGQPSRTVSRRADCSMLACMQAVVVSEVAGAATEEAEAGGVDVAACALMLVQAVARSRPLMIRLLLLP